MSHQRFSPATCALLMLAAVVFWLVTGVALADAVLPSASTADASPASVLRARHLMLRSQLDASVFKRPLLLESSLTSRDVKGDIYAVVPSDFGKVAESLATPQGWCEILILHLNTKFCTVAGSKPQATLSMNVGKKFDQPLDDSYRLAFAWQLTEQKSDFLRVQMTADAGPLSTRDYRIMLEAVPLEGGKTFLHLAYSYGFGMTGKFAMQAYFSTVGRNKVGFTTIGKTADGEPAYVDGMRGLVERNTMRYYLAIESFLGALAVPERMQFEKRINDWFNAVERYPRQLHEMERADYLAMKRREYLRQQSGGKTELPGHG